MKAPLLIGCDITNMTDDTYEILTNSEVIAIDQDSLGTSKSHNTSNMLGIQGKIVAIPELESEIWAGEISDDRWAVILLNKGLLPKTITAYFTLVLPTCISNATSDIGVGNCTCEVRDLWAHEYVV